MSMTTPEEPNIPRLQASAHESPRGSLPTSDSDTSNTHSSEEFDWDKEDEINDPHPLADQVKAKRGRRLWLAFMRLARPARVVLVSTIGIALLVTPLIVVNVRFKDNPVKIQVHVWSLWLTVIWAASCITYLFVDAIPRIVIAIMVLFGAHIERLKIQLELVMAVSPWIKLALDISWAWISLSVIRFIYQPSGAYWIIINRVMQTLFAAGIILFAEKLFLRFVSINFHEKALSDRLAENRLGLKALDCLSNAHPATHKKSHNTKRSRRNPGISTTPPSNLRNDTLQTGGDSATQDEKVAFIDKNVRSPNARRRRKRNVASVIVDQMGGAIGQVALKDSRFNKEGEIGGLYSARRLARKLFSVLSDVRPDRSHLVVEDFYPYFRSTAEAHEAFSVFDKDGNGDITKREMREAVQRIYRERKSLVSGLKDVSSIIAKLDAVLLCIAFIGIFFVCLLVFSRTNTLASLVPLATIILGFSFIFGHSAQTLFESLIFIFSTHIFDVGDLVMIDDQVLFVEEFGLFATTFRRVDGQKIIAPNALLASTKLVHNVRRSKSMWESTTLTVSYNTPLEVIERLRLNINTYINDNSREWSGCALNIEKMDFQNAITLTIAIEHRPNWQDWGGRWTRRNGFMRFLKTTLEELDIRYTMPVQPVLLPRPPMQAPHMGTPEPRSGPTPDLGNAGFYQGGDFRAPGRTLRAGVSSFD